MMKSNSLANRILALALTLVMVLGMLPSGLVTAEETDTTTIYFDPLDEWEAAGYTYSLFYAIGANNDIFLDITDSDGDGIYEVAIDAETAEKLQTSVGFSFYVYAEGQSGTNGSHYTWAMNIPTDGNNLYTATTSDRRFEGTWSVYTPSVTPPEEPDVPEVTYVAQVGETKYETLAEAVAAAESGATVTLLGNASGAGVVINKDITIDFGGYTYTFTEGVGSTGTESNGLQILAGNEVTIKNGKLEVAAESAAKFYILVQNYADLTVTDMTLDGTNLDKWSATDGDSYVLSINSGNVTIENTNIIANDEGDKAYAFDVCQYQSYAAPSVTVNSGNFQGKVDTSAIGNSTFTIEGGTFTDLSVAPYVAEDKKLNESGTVVSKTYVAETGGKKYETLAEAVAAAEFGAAVTLLGNASGAGVVINKNITIDFGGYTYTFTEGVGSTGTESNGLQILSGNNVTLKNGTLKVAAESADKFYMLIQNYANLTVSCMTLDGTNLDKWSATDGDSYALSINSGNVTIEDTTIIANNDGDLAYAFDVCQYGSYAAPSVTVTGGDFQGNVDTSAIGESIFVISGGTFTNDISEYVVDTMVAVYENGKYIVRLKQADFHFVKNEETVVYTEGLTYTNSTFGGNGKLTYTVIEGSEIATVDSTGKLTITGTGTVVVQADVSGNETYAPASITYTLTVAKGVSSIDVENENVALTFGVDSYENTVTTVGDGEITYTISETDVAVTIDAKTGKLTFDDTVDQMGTFTVTISMAEGDNYNATSATYTVTLDYAETPAVPFTLTYKNSGEQAEPNAQGWYNQAVYLAPAEGYQICLQEDLAEGKWSANGLSFENGVYENVTVYLKDANGNITEAIEIGTLKIDNVIPAVSMEVVNAVWKTIAEKLFFITKEDVTLKITVSDETSGIADVQISLDSGESFYSLGNKREYILNTEHRDTVVVKVVDNAGLENGAKSEGTIVVDRSDPGIKAEFTGTDATSNDVLFTDGVDFSVKYTVDENNLDLHDKNLVVTINGAIQSGWTLSDAGIVEQLLTGEGVYQITATFTDVAGNAPATVTNTYVIDTVAPTITLNPGETKVVGDVHYTAATDYGVVITINEDLYDTYLAHGVAPVVTVNGKVEDLNWNTNAATLNLLANGVYEIAVSYDNLVHETVTETITIVVDHEVPVITLTPDIKDEDKHGEFYYTAEENYGLEISLNENLYEHYLSCGFKPVVTVNNEPVDLDWTKPETTLTLDKNGVYEVVVSYENYLHKAETQTITIVVDHEVPVITLTPDIELVEKGVYYTAEENYGLKITLDEDLYDYYLSCNLKPVVTVNNEPVDLDWTKPETTLTLDKNGVYEVVVSYENYLHKAETQTITIVVDHEVPVITLTPDIELVEKGVYYTAKENYGLKITLDEDLYDYYLSCGLEPVVTVNGKQTKLDWTKPETTLTLDKNGVYEVVVSYENYLHKAETQTITIVVDHEVPVIELLDGIEDPDLLVDGIFYTDNENYKLTIHLTEDLYDYYLTCGIAPDVTVNGTVTDLEWNKTKDEAVLEAVLPLTEDGVYEIVVRYGHYLHTADEKTITICKDTVDPEVTISYRDAVGNDTESKVVNHVGETVFADAVTAVITVTDVNFDKRNDFVELIVTPSNQVEEKNAYNGEKMVATWTKVEGKDHTWECVLPLNQAADYDILFNCQDYANNPAQTATANLAVDIAEMPDSFKFGYSYSVHGEILEDLTLGFWKNQLTVTVDVVDDISGVEYFTASYSVAEDAYQNGNAAGLYEERKDLEVLVSEEITNGYRVTFLVPKEMLTKDNQVNGYITVTAYDYAGNVNSATDGVRVIVDNIDPTRNVELTTPVNETETVKYYDGTIVLKANIFEANYRFYNDAVVTIMKDGAPYNQAGHVTGWYKGDANATNTITLTEDGDYVVTITYTDGSGNKMADYSSGNLTLDTVAPVITVSNIKQNSANKDETYGFTITVNDINLDAATVQAKLTAVVKDEDGKYVSKDINLGSAQESEDGTTVTYTVENLDEDALYTLTCSAEDMSDNLCTEILLEDGKTYETVNFSINRNGSAYGFGSDYMTDLVNQYYVYSVYEDLVIVEVNVDPIENYTVTVNGEELVEDTHFTTTQTSYPGEWSIRTYTIDKSYFAEEGEYNVIVTSTDKTETTAYSDIKDLAICFVVDQTAPILTISGLQTGGRYQTEEQTVTLIPTDEGGRLNSLKVVVMDANGNPITDESGNDISVRFEYSGEELLDYLSENGEMVTFTIPSGLEQQVKIVCNDCALNKDGVTNEYNGTFSRVTVSQNALVIFYANKPVFFGTLGGLAALIILIVVLLKKKKSDKK